MSDDVLGFVEEARRYCAFVEVGGAMPLDDRLREARVRLVALYAAAIALPDVDPPEGFDAGPSPGRPASWRGFEHYDAYWLMFDPYRDEKRVAGDLSGELAEIYGDIRSGLDLWDSNAPREAAIWEWRFGLENHWGYHATGVLRALHAAIHPRS